MGKIGLFMSQIEFDIIFSMKTIRDYLDSAVKEVPSAVFQRFHDGEKWIEKTFAEVRERVDCAVALVRECIKDEPLEDVEETAAVKFPVGKRIAIMLENSPDWQVLYIAVAGSGLAVVPIDPKLRAVEVKHILKDSGANAIFFGSKQLEVVEEASEELPELIKIVDPSTRLDAVSEKDRKAAHEWYDNHRPTPETLASLIYTSGTTGKPKGAMLTHANFVTNAEATNRRVPFYSTDNFINVLPLFHAFSFMGNFLLPLLVKGSTSFIRSLRTIADDMLEVKPTVLLAVPLLAEKLYQRIDQNIKKSFVTSGLFKVDFARKLIARKIVERFGGKMRVIGIGGAPTAIETLVGFQKIGLFVLEGFGITECAPGVAYPNPANFIPGTVGPVLDNIEFKIVDQDESGAGELLVKGPNVTKGYWNNPEQTAAAFDKDGYYKTGDIVRLVKGCIKICGRTKALIVNREGKNIYPEEIEHALEHAPLVKDAIVVGYHVGVEVGEHVGAIIVPDEDAVKAHLKEKSMTKEEISSFIVEYAQGVCRASVADYKQPRKFVVQFEPLERTSTMKVRRVVYAGSLDEDAQE